MNIELNFKNKTIKLLDTVCLLDFIERIEDLNIELSNWEIIPNTVEKIVYKSIDKGGFKNFPFIPPQRDIWYSVPPVTCKNETND